MFGLIKFPHNLLHRPSRLGLRPTPSKRCCDIKPTRAALPVKRMVKTVETQRQSKYCALVCAFLSIFFFRSAQPPSFCMPVIFCCWCHCAHSAVRIFSCFGIRVTDDLWNDYRKWVWVFSHGHVSLDDVSFYVICCNKCFPV